MTDKSSTSIEQIRAELEAATPGPWYYQPELLMERPGVMFSAGGTHPELATCWDERDSGVTTDADANAALIANAPTYLAALLDVAEAAEAKMAHYRRVKGMLLSPESAGLLDALDRLNDLLPQFQTDEQDK